jgi:hypothetical protein
MNDAANLARILAPLMGTCRICGCHGDACSLETGDRCCWVNALRTLCSKPSCVIAADRQRKQEARAQKREEERLAALPAWLRRRREETMAARKRQKRKTKGRAA